MTFQTTYNYNDAADYTFDAGKVEISSGKAQLKLTDETGKTFTEDFVDDTGFTYDNTKAEFAAGVARQLGQNPTNSILGAEFGASLDASWSTFGANTHTTVGAPVLTANKLGCPAGNNAIYYEHAAIGNIGELGAMKFKFTPGYTGSPPANTGLSSLYPAAGLASVINLFHGSTGAVRLTTYNSAGGVIFTASNFAVWAPTAGVEYTIELLWDYATYGLRLYIDGVKLGGDLAVGGATRGTSATRQYLGANPTYTRADGDFDDILLLTDDTQDETYLVPANLYVESNVSLPAFVYGGLGNIQAFTNLASTEVGTVQYIIDNKYWSGAAWVASDGSFAQSNPIATINTNIGSLNPSDSPVVEAVFTTSGTLSSVDDLILTYTGQYYATDSTIDPTIKVQTNGLNSISSTTTEPAGSEIKYVVYFGSSPFYWNGAAWVASDISAAQANTLVEVNTNASSLDLSAGGIMSILVVFDTDGITQPSIDELSLDYDFSISAPNSIAETVVYVHFHDISQGDFTNMTDSKLQISNKDAFYHSGKLFPPTIQTASFDANGRAEIGVVETASISEKMSYKIVYKENDQIREVSFVDIEVPNTGSADLTSFAAINN